MRVRRPEIRRMSQDVIDQLEGAKDWGAGIGNVEARNLDIPSAKTHLRGALKEAFEKARQAAYTKQLEAEKSAFYAEATLAEKTGEYTAAGYQTNGKAVTAYKSFRRRGFTVFPPVQEQYAWVVRAYKRGKA